MNKNTEIQFNSPLDRILEEMKVWEYKILIKKLPDLLEVDNSSISRWRNGQTIPTKYLPKLAKALDVDIKDLI